MSSVAVTCPACGTASDPVSSFIAFCGECGHRWLSNTQQDHAEHEARTYTSDYAGYRPDPKFVATATAVTRAELAMRVPPPGRVLDVGCGAGDFMIVAKSLGYDVEGIDISEASADICQSKGLNACAANFLSHEFDGNFDLITMWDVVEHLRDPSSFFERAGGLLSKRGYIFAKIPGFGDLTVALSNWWPRAAGTLLGAPNHVQYFDRESLSALLARNSFEVEWFDAGNARSPPTGGSLKRRLARHVRRVVKVVSGDANLYVLARPARQASQKPL